MRDYLQRTPAKYVDETSHALITLVTDHQLAMRLGQQGRKGVVEKFDDLVMAEKIARIFRNFVKP